jgi:transcriptional regulator with XRE-family HTH domain
MNTTVMRVLRQKHGVSLAELARCARVSPQYISGIELGEYPATDNAKWLAKSAFERLIELRQEQTSQLAEDFAEVRECLLDSVDVTHSLISPDGAAGTRSDHAQSIRTKEVTPNEL